MRDISLKNPTIRFDVFSEDGILKACIPDDEIIVVNIENNSRGSNNNGYIGDNLCNSNNCYDEMAARSILSGHLQAVNACLYRRSHQQVSGRFGELFSPDLVV
ncbi:unnamed protein product [Anisakis simplex]|uniref:Uncharacterized protein n=1 Tax=Anisakis simplex TaxID=6269 RepID=A0A3P6PN63_ANISI|nr:unnamed protein product [Anisakis simplex]